jgi:hypothetical protein
MRAIIGILSLLLPSLCSALHLHCEIDKEGFHQVSGITFKIEVQHNTNGTSQFTIEMVVPPPPKNAYYVPDFYFPHEAEIKQIVGWEKHPNVTIKTARTTTTLKTEFSIPTIDIPHYQWSYKVAGQNSMGGFVFDIKLSNFSKNPTTE